MAHTREDVASDERSHEHSSQPGKRTKEFYQRIGALGGKVIKERYGSVYYAAIGRKGGLSTKKLRGRAHYQQMGKRSGNARSHKH